MKVTANQNMPHDVQVPTIFWHCHHCYSILEIEKPDISENADKYGKWFSVKCKACEKETGVPEILVRRLK